MESLENGGMFGINRNDFRLSAGEDIINQPPPCHQRFLIRQGDPFTGEGSSDSRTESRESNDGIKDDIDIGMRCNLFQAILTGEYFTFAISTGNAKFFKRSGISDAHKAGVKLRNLVGQQGDIGVDR